MEFLPFFLWAIMGCICAYIAKNKARNPYAWFFIGVFLGLIGLIILYFLRPLGTVKGDNRVNPTPKHTPLLPKPITSKEILNWYFLDHDRKQFGPMSFDALKKEWGGKKINARTYVWNEKMENWKKIEELPEELGILSEEPPLIPN